MVEGVPTHIGVAIITYKRPDHLRECLDAVLGQSIGKYSLIVSSDEMDNPDVDAVCRERRVPLIQGPNRGVVWNKNRALHYFMRRTDCDPIILLEDDAMPVEENWLQQWARATRTWHHVNYSAVGTVTRESLLRGDGTPDDPHRNLLLTGQCTSTSREAMDRVGYIDPRFQGYGYGHVEWSIRQTAMMHPGLKAPAPHPSVFVSIRGGVAMGPSDTFKTDADLQRNAAIYDGIRLEPARFREPWLDEAERLEMESQVRGAPDAIVKQGFGANVVPSDFDGNEYLRLHADVLAARLDPGYHYLTYGRIEGRAYKEGTVFD